MYRKHMIWDFIIFIIAFVLIFLLNTTEINETILTALSIVFGFNLTAYISLHANQNFIKKMEETMDPKSKLKQTKMQTINKYFKFSFMLSIIDIFIIIINCVINPKNILLLNRILTSGSIALFIVLIFTLLLLLRILMNSYEQK